MQTDLASPGLQLVRPLAPPQAVRLARANLSANLAALSETQPEFLQAVDPTAIDRLNWVFARDGSLTVRSEAGWWDGCSLPLRAARQQLSTLDANGPVSCFLDPPHPASIRVVLDKTNASQATIVLSLGYAKLPVLLAAEDLSTDIRDHRVWFIAGDDWELQIRSLLDSRPGLPTPTQFVRLNLPDSNRLDPTIESARQIIADVTSRRSESAKALAAGWTVTPNRQRLCIVTSRSFRLGDEAGQALAATFATTSLQAASTEPDLRVFDSDDPLSSSTYELLRKAVECDALLTADFARGDVQDLLPQELPWVCWTTNERIPSGKLAGPNDRLLVADPRWVDRAKAAGWRAEAVAVAGWPGVKVADAVPAQDARLPASIAIIADTFCLDSPAKLDDFSSRRLIWQTLREEIEANPWAVGIDPVGYFRSRLKHFDIDDPELDHAFFIRRLIEPAFAQGVARSLLAHGIPLRLYGAGWKDLQEFEAASAGPITSRKELVHAAQRSWAVIDVRPAAYRDSLYSLGKPVIRCGGRLPLAVRQDVTSALAGRLAIPTELPELSPTLVLQVLSRGSGLPAKV